MTRFGHDVGVATLTFRPLALWLLGYPKTALEETDVRSRGTRDRSHPTLLFALSCTAFTHICCRDAAAAATNLDECIALAQEKVPFFNMFAGAQRGCVLAQTGEPRTQSKRSMPRSPVCGQWGNVRATVYLHIWLWPMQRLGNSMMLALHWRSNDSGRNNQGRMVRSRVDRVAGEIALNSPEPDAAKAEAISSARSPSPVSNKPSPGNSAPQ